MSRGSMRCARWAFSPRPLRVGTNTSAPVLRSNGVTLFQHQPPCHAPWTNTKVAILLHAARRTMVFVGSAASPVYIAG